MKPAKPGTNNLVTRGNGTRELIRFECNCGDQGLNHPNELNSSGFIPLLGVRNRYVTESTLHFRPFSLHSRSSDGLTYRNPEINHQDSILIVSINARLQDYLMEKDSSKIVEGNKKYKDIEQIWSFTLEEGVWKVSNIEEYASLGDYLKQAAHLPKIENTLNHTH